MTEKQRQESSWVVYRPTVFRRGDLTQEANAVCAQSEWDEIDRRRPGYHTLVLGGIASEAEAERVARGAPGGTAIR